MKVSGQLQQRKVQHTALRALTLGLSAKILVEMADHHSIPADWVYLCNIFSYCMLCIALAAYCYSRLKNFPAAEVAFSPSLKLPNTMVSGGYDSEKEPVEYWMWESRRKKSVLLATENRQIRFAQSVLSDQQWQRIIDALPSGLQNDLPSLSSSLQPALIVFCLGFITSHYVLADPSEYSLFNLLARGGYNGAIISHGEFHRVLSYSWLHASNLHLWTNFFAFVLVAQTLGKTFTNKTLCSVLTVTAIVSGTLGTIGKEFSVLIGASGAIMGVFGFLFAAQRNRDQRLSPLARESRQKTLYALLFIEFYLSLKFAWYGGMVHLAGFGCGFAMYWLLEKGNKRQWQRRAEWGILATGLIFFLSWAVHTYQYMENPKLLVQQAVATEDPFQIMLAATALPDLPDATEAEVRAAQARALELLPTSSIFNWPIARTDFWLGNNQAALDRLRSYSIEASGNAEIRKLWLAVELEVAAQTDLGIPERSLPKGPATAYLISADARLFARINLPKRASPITEEIRSENPIAWQLLTVTGPIENSNTDTYNVWPVPTKKFRTALTANLAVDASR